MAIRKILSGCMILGCMVNSNGQTTFSNGTKHGLMDTGNKVILPAVYDDISDPSKKSLSDYKDLFILRKGKSYSFALKQYWETCESNSYGFSCTTDSTQWFISDDTFDTLYILGGDISDRNILRYKRDDDEKRGSKIPLSNSRSYYVLGYRKGIRSGIITYEHNFRETQKKHEPGNGIGKDYDYSKTIRSVGNVIIHPEKYDHIIPPSEKRPIVTMNKNKYGIIRIAEGYETPLLFDSIPVFLTEQFYYCKKNGLWGVCFLKEQDSVPLEVIPHRYANIQTIQNDCRKLFLYNQGGMEKYPACVYTTTENTVLKLRFIINRLYFGQSSKDYSFPEVKYIDLTPKMNGAEVIQQKEFEFLFTATRRSSYDSKPPTFFLVKTERIRQFSNGDNNFYLWPRGTYKTEHKSKALVAYRLENDTFSIIHEFSDESKDGDYAIFDYADSYHDITFILKSTHLENGNYTHAFFTTDGIKVYEISANSPIDYWDLLANRSKNSPLTIKFYTETQGKKGTEEHIICSYNTVTGKFSK